MHFGSLDSGGDCEYNGPGFVEVAKMFAMQDSFFFGKILFDRVYINISMIVASPDPGNVMLMWRKWPSKIGGEISFYWKYQTVYFSKVPDVCVIIK